MLTPNYQTDDGKIKLFCGDALTVAREFDRFYFNAVIADPPYNITGIEWDSLIDIDLMWYIIKHHTGRLFNAILFGAEPYATHVRASNLDQYKYDIIWRKTTPTNFMHARNRPLREFENIMVFSSGKIGHQNLLEENRMTYNPQMRPGKPYKKFNYAATNSKTHGLIRPSHHDHLIVNEGERFPTDIWEVPRDNVGEGNVLHPTQKPLELMIQLVKTFTNPGDKVLDFCMGSGTTGLACLLTGREFVGIELDPNNYEIAENRIKNGLGQFELTNDEKKKPQPLLPL